MKENTKLVLAIVVFLLISLIILPNIIKKNMADVVTDTPVTNIEEDPEATEAPITIKVYKQTTGNLNLRTGPGTDYSIILTIPAGEMVEIMENDEGWDKVIYQGEIGYCSSEFLQ
mgnify:CR=1 FL=1